MRITIKNDAVHADERTDKQGGKFTMYFQEAFFSGGEETLKVRVPVESPARAYPAGEYTFASQSFVRNRFQNLELGRVVLERLPGAK